MTKRSTLLPNWSVPADLSADLRAKASEIYELPCVLGAARIPAMEGLRGLAVLLVFGVHYHALFGLRQNPLSTTFRISAIWECLGHSGVDLFFLMSGFLIFGALVGKTTPLLKFMRRRIQRIYPTFLAVFVLYLILSAIFPTEDKIPGNLWEAERYILANLLLLPGMLDIQPIITVAWSLSYEIFFYLFLPLFIALLDIRSWSPKIRPIFFSMLAAGYLTACFLGIATRPRLAMFFAGIALFDVLKGTNRSRLQGSAIDRIGISALLVTLGVIFLISLEPRVLSVLPRFHEISWTYREVALVLGFPVFAFCALNSKGILGAMLSWTPLRWLGNISYSYYLIHGLTLKGAAMIFGRLPESIQSSQLFFWSALPVCLVATFVSSTILYLCIEKRFSIATPVASESREQLHITTPQVEIAG